MCIRDSVWPSTITGNELDGKTVGLIEMCIRDRSEYCVSGDLTNLVREITLAPRPFAAFALSLIHI